MKFKVNTGLTICRLQACLCPHSQKKSIVSYLDMGFIWLLKLLGEYFHYINSIFTYKYWSFLAQYPEKISPVAL